MTRRVEKHEPVTTPGLVQGTGIVATQGDGGVATAAQLVAVGEGQGGTIIGVASEAFDAEGGGANALVGAESAVIDRDDDYDTMPHYGHNSVAKVRMDNDAPVRHRVLGNSAAYFASSQPETGFQDLMRAQPGSIDRHILNVAGNPGATLGRFSGDMVLWRRDGAGVNKLYLPVVVDGVLWGIPLTHLGA